MKIKKLSILGATGSIGDNTLDVVRANPDRLEVVGIAGKHNFEKLAKIAKEFNAKYVAIYDEDAYSKAKTSGLFDSSVQLFCGEEGLTIVATLSEIDTVVAAVVGTTALKPTLAAIQAGKDIALANKELLVMAGKFVMGSAKENKVQMLPLDSEHNAIFQCLVGERQDDIAKLLITASGGMFKDYTLEQMQQIKPEQALKHPNWNMGPKVTIDSSTLANKGLEVIEAKWLFDVSPDQIQVVVQRQSIVHSMVQFRDGSIKAHFSPPSMTFAISHSLLYGKRGLPSVETIDFTKPMTLDFAPPDVVRFPCLAHAFSALRTGGTATTCFNASNEVAVAEFIKGRLPWIEIATVVGKTLECTEHLDPQTLDDVLQADALARRNASDIIAKLGY
ncbi:MAG: 1-deoxy-D-xylulose-5-phosphate reductoisomerase [Verrucomicrobiaceae bacterium]|nr:1-deoxy-D-xylulose-5-phosphate reductoisomerase [Verrucomicrobiaceae bacterium]